MSIHTDLEERWQDMADEAYEDERPTTPEERIRRLQVDRNYTYDNLLDDILSSRSTVGETGKLERPAVTSDTVAASAAAIERMERAAELG